MDALDIFVKQSYVISGHFNLEYEDFAALLCINKNLNIKVNEVYGKDNEELIINKMASFGISRKYLEKDHLINISHCVKAFVLIKRLVRQTDQKKTEKLIKFMNNFTSIYMQEMFLKCSEASLETQIRTLHIMLDITSISPKKKIKYIMMDMSNTSRPKELRYVVCYMIMYFIQRLIKHNTRKFIKDEQYSIVASKIIRNKISSKASTLSEKIKNEICMLPYGFINRFARILGDTRIMVDRF